MTLNPALRNVLMTLCISLPWTAMFGFVPLRDQSGQGRTWPNMPVTFQLDKDGSRDVPTADAFAAVRSAFSTWESLPDCALAFSESAPADLSVSPLDGTNAIVFAENADEAMLMMMPEATMITIVASDVNGQIVDADILVNGVQYTWTTAPSTGFSASSGPLDIESVALHEIGHLLGLDHVIDRRPVMASPLAPGSNKKALSQDEVSAIQELYPPASPQPRSSIQGRIERAGIGVSFAYAAAHQNGVPVVGAMADVNGDYKIPAVPPGTYLVKIHPYTNHPDFNQALFYTTAADTDVLATYYQNASDTNPSASPTATPVVVVAGQDTLGIDVSVSPGATPDPFEPDNAVATPISKQGFSQLHSFGMSGDDDLVGFDAVAGRLYVIETLNLGVGASSSPLDPLNADTTLALFNQGGANRLDDPTQDRFVESDNKSTVNGDLSSRIVWVAGSNETYFVSVLPKTAAQFGAGFRYDIRVSEATGPFATPTISAVDPGQVLTTGGSFVRVMGTNFMPGAQVQFGSTAGTEENVRDCSTPTSCTTIEVRVPLSASAGPVNVTVTNPDGQMAVASGLFSYADVVSGVFQDASYGTLSPDTYVGDGTSICWGDFDNDGDPDLFHPYRASFTSASGELLRNVNGTHFEDVTVAVGLDPMPPFRSSCAWVDINNDGLLDLFLSSAGVGGPNQVYYQLSPGNFFEVAAAVNLSGDPAAASTDGAWADFDNDGDLDLYLAYTNMARPNQLFENFLDESPTPCGSFFCDVAASARVDLQSASARVLWGDYDGDGFDDLYLVNRSGEPDVLYHNNGNGTFTDVTSLVGIEEASNCYDAYWEDLNRDNLLDLVCVGAGSVSFPNRLWLNSATGIFVEFAAQAGVTPLGPDSRAVVPLDHDNDGDTDLFIGQGFNAPDSLLEYDPFSQPIFSDVAVQSGIDKGIFTRNGDVAGTADFDSDGFPDIVVSGFGGFGDDTYLWRNVSNSGDYLTLRLEGTYSNRLGAGAIVEVSRGPGEQSCGSVVGARKTVSIGSRNQSSVELEFGLGSSVVEDSAVDCVRVEWPVSGLVQVFQNVAANQVVDVVEDPHETRPTRVIPASGSTSGNENVRVIGFAFPFPPGQNIDVAFGANTVTCTSVSLNELDCVTPPGPAGPADVSINGVTLSQGYSYVDPSSVIQLQVAKQPQTNSIVITWTEIGQKRYSLHRAPAPTSAAFVSAVDDSLVVSATTFTELTLGNGIDSYYLVVEGMCGNSILDAAEACEGALLGGASCSSIGFSGGSLSCSDICTFDVTQCVP